MDTIVKTLKKELGKFIIGQEYMIDRLMIGLLGGGHILLEGVPGVAKTLAIKTLAHLMHGEFKRIQFTPDLLPADVIGTTIYNPEKKIFEERKGPLFGNFILADEINRAPAKVQSALLEAMQEQQVTIGTKTFPLDKPFLVLATQNPLEQEGTYPLPEAQLDRFMLKVEVNFPSEVEEKLILRNHLYPQDLEKIPPVITLAEISDAKEMVKKVFIDATIEQYIIDIVFMTRYPEKRGLPEQFYRAMTYGASPRATINLALAAKAHAYMSERDFVLPADVKAISLDVLRHRIGLTYETQFSKMSTKDIVEAILNQIPTP